MEGRRGGRGREVEREAEGGVDIKINIRPHRIEFTMTLEIMFQ